MEQLRDHNTDLIECLQAGMHASGLGDVRLRKKFPLTSGGYAGIRHALGALPKYTEHVTASTECRSWCVDFVAVVCFDFTKSTLDMAYMAGMRGEKLDVDLKLCPGSADDMVRDAVSYLAAIALGDIAAALECWESIEARLEA